MDNSRSQSRRETSAPIEALIARWRDREGGQERANFPLFLIELCDALDLPRPDPAGAATLLNDYVFERRVDRPERDGTTTHPRIDLYRRGCFVLEAKQSRIEGGAAGQLAIPGIPAAPGRAPGRGWDVLMLKARRQAEGYVALLPAGHDPPPFLVVCDVGRCFEVYANFRRDGKVYHQFPDRQGFRIALDDLRVPEVRDRLRAIWTDPLALDPAREAARVTRAIAERLAAVSRLLERRGEAPEAVALFLMRCLFTMFAADVGLLPPSSFGDVLEACEADPSKLAPKLRQLWQAMDAGGYAHAIDAHVRRFNGAFFRDPDVLALGREEIGELRRAAAHSWRDVDPSIFGTLLEQALDPAERRRLGAHYTPRPYVERLVVATVIEPLRADWLTVQATAERQKSEGRLPEARAGVVAFHGRLCATRVLDPACGTGNFLYVALELMKRLEGEVLEDLVALGGQEALTGLGRHGIDPHQFLGLEINPRAAAIAELVLWIGHLQWHLRTRGGLPNDPVLEDYGTVRKADALLGPDGRPSDWPEAEFIVGNPPFLGGKDLRARRGDGYAEALWRAYPAMNDAADYVTYWWHRAAVSLAADGTALRRFGFVTTNSISQVFGRRIVARHLAADPPVSILLAVPDHPWTRASRDAAAVRIAMTVCAAGRHPGVVLRITAEAGLETDAPRLAFAREEGMVNADLTVGADIASCRPLRANDGLCSPGVKLHGAGFIVTPAQAAHLGLGRRPGLDAHIRHYRNGRDLAARSRGALVIDLFGLGEDEVRRRFPEVYQHLAETVKPDRDGNARDSYRDAWWIFGEPRRALRPALDGLPRFIATVETAKHRAFQFLPAEVVPDNMLVVVASDDAFHLGVLSSRLHGVWARRAGGWLGIGNDPRYSKTRCFDPFPFPATDARGRAAVAAVAEEIDAHRKRVLHEHPGLTLTGLYNVRGMIRAGTRPADLDAAGRATYERGLVLILDELHGRLDRAVAAAYGWPAALAAEEILHRLAALNAERSAEERRGLVRWLRPAHQAPTRVSAEAAAELDLAPGAARAAERPAKIPFPADDVGQTAMVYAALARATGALDADAIASRFRQGRRVVPKVLAVLSALHRLGVVGTGDGGASFALPRGA